MVVDPGVKYGGSEMGVAYSISAVTPASLGRFAESATEDEQEDGEDDADDEQLHSDDHIPVINEVLHFFLGRAGCIGEVHPGVLV